VQRLFATFPSGLPGAGLLLLRITAAVPLIYTGLLTVLSPALVIKDIVTAGGAILLLLGFWTPLAGSLIAVVELGRAWWSPADPWTLVQAGVLGAALAMLGPGAYSVDARLFGRKHIQIPER
jgi:putative oxidoreductase